MNVSDGNHGKMTYSERQMEHVFHSTPPLWSKEGKDIERSMRKPVPAEEQFLYNLQLRQSMGLEKNSN